MITFAVTCAVAYVIAFVYASFFEWALHKYIMHMDIFMKYAYRTHQLEHHEIFKADQTYFLNQDPHTDADLKHVTFAWWNAPLLIGLHLPLFTLAYFFAGGLAAVIGSVVAMISYYALYEYLHFCMHVPANRPFENTRFFKFVQTHHRLHHVHYMKNLNVVVPIADVILGTRIGLNDSKLFQKLEMVRIKRLMKSKAAEAEEFLKAATASAATATGAVDAV